jgi:hypothetical protein
MLWHPIIVGSIGEITEPIDHNDFRGITKFINRHTDYAIWESKRLATIDANGEEARKYLTKRQIFKYRHLSKWWFPWLYFLLTYFGKKGFLDGGSGFAYAFYKTWYFFTIRLLILEHKKKK